MIVIVIDAGIPRKALAQDHHRNGKLLQDLLMSRRKYGSDQDNSIDLVLGQHTQILDLFLLIIIRIGKEELVACFGQHCADSRHHTADGCGIDLRDNHPDQIRLLRPQRLGLGGRLIPGLLDHFSYFLFFILTDVAVI